MIFHSPNSTTPYNTIQQKSRKLVLVRLRHQHRAYIRTEMLAGHNITGVVWHGCSRDRNARGPGFNSSWNWGVIQKCDRLDRLDSKPELGIISTNQKYVRSPAVPWLLSIIYIQCTQILLKYQTLSFHEKQITCLVIVFASLITLNFTFLKNFKF